MKQGEVAMSLVIIIALGLLALILLATMLVQSGGDARETTSACENTYGGTCTTLNACERTGGRVIASASCSKSYTTNYDNAWRIQDFPVGGGVCCAN